LVKFLVIFFENLLQLQENLEILRKTRRVDLHLVMSSAHNNSSGFLPVDNCLSFPQGYAHNCAQVSKLWITCELLAEKRGVRWTT
jgi:hypothetical protein